MIEQKLIYIDTSFYLATLLGNLMENKVAKLLNGSQICSSTLLLLESERNLVRLAREKNINERQFEKAFLQLLLDKEIFLLRDFTLDLCLNSEFPAIRLPRSLDLAHLRTAKWFAREYTLSLFLTRDSAQRDAAREMGLPVGEA